MKALRTLIIYLGRVSSIWTILALIIALNVSWVVALDAIGKEFQQLAGRLPIDLQNTSSILTASQAVDQMTAYPPQARIFYWVFFTLDNIMPPLVFGAFALLWAYYLTRRRNKWVDRLLASPFLLIPLGVGIFDWLENLCFITVLTNPTATSALQIMEVGLIFTRLKAGFLFTTFGLTFALTVYYVITLVRTRWFAVDRQGVAARQSA
jgi:hypothetical protein